MSHRTDSADTDFIQLFYEATDSQNSPEIFRLWAGIGSVACAVQRRTWVHTFARLYPNMYIFLVSPPGIGKTVVTAVAGDLLTKLPGHFTASSNLSRASFVDELADARRDLIQAGREKLKPSTPSAWSRMNLAPCSMRTILTSCPS